jgi:tRNA modification GTPase
MPTSRDTIAAIATPPGRGGIGIIRVSGDATRVVANRILGRIPKPRYALYTNFVDAKGDTLDQGIALFYPTPNSFTGEDVLELQGHGGPVILDLILKEILALGVRMARPGEFSERAYLNDKIDLAQAEAIADLIDSASQQAARGAMASLQGVFSRKVEELVESLTILRTYVEASIDFPDEEVDFLSDGKVIQKLDDLLAQIEELLGDAVQGTLLREGMTVVLAGKPNAGKSSLLNLLSGKDSAIVTATAGTTRDLLREYVHLDGMPLHLVDTAGLRSGTNEIEMEGIKRAWAEMELADRVLLLVDASESAELCPEKIMPEFAERLPNLANLTVVRNKVDLIADETPAGNDSQTSEIISVSAKTGFGIENLKQHLKSCMGFSAQGEGQFTARRRHLDALEKARDCIAEGRVQLVDAEAGELLAESLRLAQLELTQITGEFTPDDLLGRIFSSFCIGK